uniref:mRNA capping enzyme adenylation domain-containing protein n=1 Tax=viral metagenome TaxID=1070528 RepID=A0A6C0JK00_9ZZZZ
MELSQPQISHLMNRFPEFELSYETISYKKVSPFYDICLAIPLGKKCYAWFTFHNDNDLCYLMDLNREKKVSRVSVISTPFDPCLSLNTIVYGTYVEEESGAQWFIIEDMVYYKGIPMKKCNFTERLAFFAEFMGQVSQEFKTKNDVVFVLPVMWQTELTESMIDYPISMPTDIYYPVHHIQYRSSGEVMPYLNVNTNKKIGGNEIKRPLLPYVEQKQVHMDFQKPQYRYPTIFKVTADIQFDIYNLYAFGKNNQPVFYNNAYIPNYKSSVFMNGLFRIIRENKNLDYIEESDDEEDFQNTNIDKYVNVEKSVLMECVFNQKFKRWTPVRVVNNREKVVHISKLIKGN